MKLLERLDATIGSLEKTLMVVFLGLMIGAAFVQIGLRNLAGVGLSWSEPLVRYLVLWVGFIGASQAAREDRHITIEIFKLPASAAAGRLLGAVSRFSAAVISALMTAAAVKFVRDDAQIGTRTFMDLPTWGLETIIPVCFAVMSLRFLLHALRALHRPPAPRRSTPPL